MNEDIEHGQEHGSLTANKLLTLCCFGLILWTGLIQTAVRLCEVML